METAWMVERVPKSGPALFVAMSRDGRPEYAEFAAGGCQFRLRRDAEAFRRAAEAAGLPDYPRLTAEYAVVEHKWG